MNIGPIINHICRDMYKQNQKKNMSQKIGCEVGKYYNLSTVCVEQRLPVYQWCVSVHQWSPLDLDGASPPWVSGVKRWTRDLHSYHRLMVNIHVVRADAPMCAGKAGQDGHGCRRGTVAFCRERRWHLDSSVIESCWAMPPQGEGMLFKKEERGQWWTVFIYAGHSWGLEVQSWCKDNVHSKAFEIFAV